MKNIVFLCLVLLGGSFTAPAQDPTLQTGHTHDILTVRFSPDDRQLASYSGGDGFFCLWDVKSGRLLWKTKTGFIRKGEEAENLNEFYWSRDGSVLVTKSLNGTYQTWDAKTGKITALTEAKPGTQLIKPMKKVLKYVKDYDGISVTDPGTGTERKFTRFGNNSALDTSNDATMIAEGGSWGDACIRITNVKTGASWWLDGHPGIVGAIAYAPDGKTIAVGGSDRYIHFFDAATGAPAGRLEGNTKPIGTLAFSPDGRFLVSGEEYGSLRVWDVPGRKLLREFPYDFPFYRTIAKFSPDGKEILLAFSGTGLELRDAEDWKLIRRFCLEKTGEEKLSYECGPEVSSAEFSPDGKRIIAAYQNGVINILDKDQPKPVKSIKYGGRENRVVTAAGGKSIIAASSSGTSPVTIFDSISGREMQRLKDPAGSGYIKGLATDPGGRYFVTSGIGGNILVWDIERSAPVHRLEIGFSGDDPVAFHPAGRTFAVGGRNQNLFVFDAETGKKLWQLIPSYAQGELEKKLDDERRQRQAKISAANGAREAQAGIDTKKYQKQVYLTFDHFGSMSDLGEKRMMESSASKESAARLSRKDANAAWLRLHNDSPLPVTIPTQSMYSPDPSCAFTFSNRLKIQGLCNGSEISIWHGLEDAEGKSIPFGFDFGASSILLPKTSVLFPVPLSILKDGNAIRFSFTFQKETGDKEYDDYGESIVLRFRESDLPKK
jgi:WD40 repeat protein